MKQLFWALMASMMLIACDPIEDKKDNVNEDACEVCGEDPCVCEDETCPDCGKNPCECTTPNPEFTPLQPSEQKAKISNVGEKLLDEMPAEEWEKYSQFAEDLANSCYVSEDYNWGKLEDWFEDHVNGAFYEEDGTLTIKGGKYTNEWVTEVVILMADHTGLFTLTENGVTISDYDGTKAVFTLNGKNYEAEIKQSGKVTNYKYSWYEVDTYNSSWNYFDPQKGEWVYTDEPITYEQVDKGSLTVGVPEQIDITLTENGTSLFSATMKLTPAFKAEEMNLTTDALSVKTTVSINGFEISADKVAYDGAAGESSVKAGLKKNGKSIFSVSSSAALKLKVEREKYESGDWTYEYDYLVAEKAQNINVSMDILGEIQAKGSCSNAVEAAEELEAVWDELSYYDNNGNHKNPNLSEANRHLDNFNAKFKINVYYDGTDTKQATVKFALAEDNHDYYDRTYYDIIPIIEFNDGSKYKIEEFFTEDAFSELIESFYELCESYDEVLGFSVEEDVQSL